MCPCRFFRSIGNGKSPPDTRPLPSPLWCICSCVHGSLGLLLAARPPALVWLFFCASCFPDAGSCTAAACEDSASSADRAYIDDNSLTLYCDDKCSDTPSDPFGGLWCNMRGLGQLCRACRADK